MGDFSSLSAEELKDKGNEAFKQKFFHKAIGFYSESLNRKLDNVVLSNRSQAFLKIEYFEAAMSDASESIRIEPTAKAYYRRACAMHNLGFHSKAREDLRSSLKINPKNPDASFFLDRILITHDRPIIPLKLLEKKPYVQSKMPMKSFEIQDIGGFKPKKQFKETPSPADSGISSNIDVSFLNEDDGLPLPAQTSMDLIVALSGIRNNSRKMVDYFMTLDHSKFSKIFQAGIEPEFVEGLLGGISFAPRDESFLQKLLSLSNYEAFDTSLMFCSDNLKKDLNEYLSALTADFGDVVQKIRLAYQLS